MTDKEKGRLAATEAAWDLAAQTYAPSVERDVELLRHGGLSLHEREEKALSRLSLRGRAIHQQDTLPLLNLGFSEVIGVDLSVAMLAHLRTD